MTRKSLYDELKRIPRGSEDSSIVASVWGAADDAYLSEIPDTSNTQYFSLTAERFLYRGKVLSLTIDKALAECEAIQSAHPFGESGPSFATLMDPSVQMAMAFVPLTPTGGNGAAVMARLYCVYGIHPVYQSPFAEGADSPDLNNYSWFVAGVHSVFKGEALSGRSWLLAANLLMQIIKAKDNATALNLATSFIVTGDVEDGNIKEVDMGQKPNLANIKEYRAYKWIIPMKNANEMTNVPSRNIEKPATLDDAYRLIESMQNKATHSFFRFLKQHDFVGMSQQYDIGADIFAEDTETGFSPLEYITRAINEKREMLGAIPKVFQSAIMYGGNDEERTNWNRRLELARELKTLECIRSWLKALGANCPNCIYMLAKLGLRDALEKVLQYYPVNAKDENGLTATDMAIVDGEADAARMLIARGGKCDAMGTRNFTIRNILKNIRNMTENMWSNLELAMDAGLSLDARSSFFDCESDDKGTFFWDTWKLQLPLHGRAIYEANERLLLLCVSHGMDPNKPFLVEYLDDAGDGGFTAEDVVNGKVNVIKREMMSPLKFAYMIGNSSSAEMLKRLGAQETEEVRVFLAEKEENKRKNLHKRFLCAIGKLCGDDDSKDNRRIVRECIEQGESVSAIVEGVRLAALETDNGFPCYVQAPLYAVAILHGWSKMLKACLDAGIPLNEEVSFTLDCDYNEEVLLDVSGMGYEKESFRKGDVVARWTPMQIAKWCNGAKKMEVVELLKQYGATE